MSADMHDFHPVVPKITDPSLMPAAQPTTSPGVLTQISNNRSYIFIGILVIILIIVIAWVAKTYWPSAPTPVVPPAQQQTAGPPHGQPTALPPHGQPTALPPPGQPTDADILAARERIRRATPETPAGPPPLVPDPPAAPPAVPPAVPPTLPSPVRPSETGSITAAELLDRIGTDDIEQVDEDNDAADDPGGTTEVAIDQEATPGH